MQDAILVNGSAQTTLTVYDFAGRIVKRMIVHGREQISTSDLKQGIYILHWTGESDNANSRLLFVE